MYNLQELLQSLETNYIHIGKSDCASFEYILPYKDADEKSLIFVNKPNKDTFKVLKETKAPVILIEINWGEKYQEEITALNKSVFLVHHPRNLMGAILKKMYPNEDRHFEGIHPTAIIDPEANIHPSVTIGPFSIIGKCVIGEESRIDAYSIVKDNVKIGKRVIIREHCTIGSAGFGFSRDDDGFLHRIPHIGGVVIEDDVQLYPYVNVDRGTFTETRVGRGTKVDHYAHIGHNSSIGEDCIITAGTVLCGKSSIGARSWTGVNCVIKEGVRVGKECTIGIGAVVLRDVEDNAVVAGVPAKPLIKKSK